MKTTTDKIFEYALDQAMPEHGEGWDQFADILHGKMSEMESLLRQVLPDYADEIGHPNGGKVCAEMTEKDVVMIRDFLANAKNPSTP